VKRRRTGPPLPARYTREDIALLAAVDEAHGTLSGPATRKLLERACYDFGDAATGASRGSRWRNSTGCGRAVPTRTVRGLPRHTADAGADRRAAPPGAQRPAGYLRVTRCIKATWTRQGVYTSMRRRGHAVAGGGRVPQISEAWLKPVLEACWRSFRSASALSFRQRQRVHQLHGGQAAEQAADRADEIAAAA